MTAPLKSVETTASVASLMQDIGLRARKAARALALAPSAQKDKALHAMAKAIRAATPDILAANESDVTEAKAAGVTGSFLDRLTLDDEPRRGDGRGARRGGPTQGSGRRGHGQMDASERHVHRAGPRRRSA